MVVSKFYPFENRTLEDMQTILNKLNPFSQKKKIQESQSELAVSYLNKLDNHDILIKNVDYQGMTSTFVYIFSAKYKNQLGLAYKKVSAVNKDTLSRALNKNTEVL